MSGEMSFSWSTDGKLVNDKGEEIVICTKAEYEGKQKDNKHLKGYMYDSLVYRYQLALYKATMTDATDIMIKEGLSKKEAEVKARINYTRDLMRFCQILDEAIGEHD